MQRKPAPRVCLVSKKTKPVCSKHPPTTEAVWDGHHLIKIDAVRVTFPARSDAEENRVRAFAWRAIASAKGATLQAFAAAKPDTNRINDDANRLTQPTSAAAPKRAAACVGPVARLQEVIAFSESQNGSKLVKTNRAVLAKKLLLLERSSAKNSPFLPVVAFDAAAFASKSTSSPVRPSPLPHCSNSNLQSHLLVIQALSSMRSQASHPIL